MSKEIQEFIEKLKDWKNNFSVQEYDYTKYDCEVANIAKWQKENNINELINFWNEKCKNDYFELKHPVYNDVITRAVNNYFDNGVRNYVFMIDKNNKYPWILLQDSHLINSCILPNKIFKIFSYWNFWGNLDEIRNILLENDKKFFYNAFPFAFLLGNKQQPQHYFTQVFASLYAISNHTILNKNLSSPAFFVLKEHKKQIKNDEKLIYIYPNLNGSIRATFDLACKKIYNDSLLYPGIYYQKDNSEYDLKVWFGFPSTPYRDWIEKYQFATLFIENCSLYFKKIKIYVDGITAYEGERIDDERNNAVYKILKEQIVKVCKNKNIDCTLFHLAGYDYRTKICYCNDCDIAISEGNTTALVPFNFCKISGVNFIPFTPWSARVGSKIVSFKDMARVYTDINKGEGLSSYHISPQHIYNLAAEVLEELSRDNKLKVKNLKMHRLEAPPVELIAKQYELEKQFEVKMPLELVWQLQQKDQIIQTKNQEIASKNQELTQTKNQLDSTKQQLDSKVKELDSKTKELSSLPIKKQTLEIKNLEQDLINKQLHTKKLEKELGYESNVLQELEIKKQELIQTKNQLDSTKKQLDSKTKELESKNKILSSNPNPSHLIQNTSQFKGKLAYLNTLTTAKDRIHNHLSYKLGQAMIENSKSLLGYIRMPYVLSYIKDKHKQEQQQYQEAIKKNPNLKLPNLESYPDYKEALKEKECLTYKLGEAFIKADKTWYKGGYVKLWFEVRKLKGERK